MQDSIRVVQFHQKFGIDYTGPPRLLPPELAWRRKFLDEELTEYEDAIAAKDIGGAFDALIDLNYVALGTIHLHGGRVDDHVPRLIDCQPRLVTDMEAAEFKVACHQLLDAYDQAEDLHDKLMALGRLIKTVQDMANTQGFPWEKGFAEVHKANMTKILAANGEGRGHQDIVKPPNFVKPDLTEVLREHVAWHFPGYMLP